MMSKAELKEAKIEFLKSLTNYCNTILEESRRQKSIHYVCINAETLEKIKKLNIEIEYL